MYNIGDQVVHKNHGAGIVTGIEERSIDGTLMKFLRVHLTLKEGDILIPCEGGEPGDIRRAMDEEGIKELEEILSGKKQIIKDSEEGTPPDPLALIATTDPFQIAQAIRKLTEESRAEDFDPQARELLSTARMKLASELMLAKDMSKAAALSFINRAIHGTEKFLKAAKKRRKKVQKDKLK